MIINFDSNNRFSGMIRYCFNKPVWSIFYNALVDYMLNPCYGTENAFIRQINFIINKTGTSTEMVSAYKETDLELINKLSEMHPYGFSNMYVVRIKTKFSIYYIKFYEDDLNKVEKYLIEYIKNNYELGIIEDYTNEFEKIKEK